MKFKQITIIGVGLIGGSIGLAIKKKRLSSRVVGVTRHKQTLKKAELPELRLHDLRHTAATLMLQQGVHPKIVQERLGHSTISLTLDTYSHVAPAMQQEVAEKMDEILTPVAVRLQ